MKDQENSRKPRNSCCFECTSSAILFGLFSRWFVPGFIISNINKVIDRPKITSFAARFCHKQKVRTFFPFAIGIFSPKTVISNDKTCARN